MIIVAGFEPFGLLRVNPSQHIVEEVARLAREQQATDLTTLVLKTQFTEAGSTMRRLIHECRPDAVLCLGVAAGLSSVCFERIAVNLDDADEPDNAGELLRGKMIMPDGPTAYWSTLPIEQMRDALIAQGIPAAISNHAGTYVCNHVFYMARHTLEELRLKSACGFIHIPLMNEQLNPTARNCPSLPKDMLVRAILSCLEILRAQSTAA